MMESKDNISLAETNQGSLTRGKLVLCSVYVFIMKKTMEKLLENISFTT